MQLNPGHREGRAPSAGFTLTELLIAISMLAVLMSLAAPSLTTWIRNTQVRTVTESLQNGVRAAQAEALRRNRQVVFFLTNDAPGLSATADEDGVNWGIRWIALPGDTVTSTAPAFEPFVQGGSLGDVARGVAITGPAAICFNSLGRRVANASTGVTDGACAIDADEPDAVFEVTRSGADRPLRVTVSLSGQVRMCDPARTLSDTAPDGCPS